MPELKLGVCAGAFQSCALLLAKTEESGQAGSVPTLQLSPIQDS